MITNTTFLKEMIKAICCSKHNNWLELSNNMHKQQDLLELSEIIRDFIRVFVYRI